MITFLRRRRLGATSCREISKQMVKASRVHRSDSGLVPNDTKTVIRWGCTANSGVVDTINTAKAIHQVNDKSGFRKFLQEKRPEIVPKTWFTVFDWYDDGCSKSIIRPQKHSQGKNLLVVDESNIVNPNPISIFTLKHPNYYISEFFDKVAEYRVFCIQGRVGWVAKKTPADPNQVAWNVAQGGRFDNVRWGDWNLKVVKIALEAFNLTDLDFGGVDVMVDVDNNVKIIEINSAPSQTSPYRQSCVAKCFDYMVENGKERIPLIEELGDWKKFAHPALNERVYR
jgi:glutathione synthase/RimK-type ligase-like ATP-grasp enzyme